MPKRNACVFILRSSLLLSAAAGVLLTGSTLYAGDPVVKKLSSGLGSHLSVAVRPEVGSHGEVYIGDREGSRILRVALDHPSTPDEVITEFPRAIVSKDKSEPSGLFSLYFLDHARLIAAGSDGEQPFVRVYELPDSSGAIRFDDQKQSIEIAAENRHELETGGVVGFRGIARPRANDHVSDTLLLVAACDKPAMGLWKIPLRANTLEDAAPFSSGKTDDKIHRVDAIAVSNSGYVAVAVATVGDGSHSMLRFIDPADGRSRLDVATDLEAIFGLAYNPVTGDLFAVGLDAGPGHEPGLYRLDDVGAVGKPRCQAKKIAGVPSPTALAFSSDGTLFVTSEEKAADGKTDGSLYKLTDF